MLSSIMLNIPASYFAVCLLLVFAIGAIVGIIWTAHLNQNQEHNDIDDPNNWSE